MILHRLPKLGDIHCTPHLGLDYWWLPPSRVTSTPGFCHIEWRMFCWLLLMDKEVGRFYYDHQNCICCPYWALSVVTGGRSKGKRELNLPPVLTLVDGIGKIIYWWGTGGKIRKKEEKDKYVESPEAYPVSILPRWLKSYLSGCLHRHRATIVVRARHNS